MAPGAMLIVKGGLRQRRWGKIYFWAMAVVAASALAMTLPKPNVFLLMIALFAFNLAFRGYCTLYHKRPEPQRRAPRQPRLRASVQADVDLRAAEQCLPAKQVGATRGANQASDRTVGVLAKRVRSERGRDRKSVV